MFQTDHLAIGPALQKNKSLQFIIATNNTNWQEL